MIATLSEEMEGGLRRLRCRYTKKSAYRCDHEIAGEPDDDVLLCPKHLHEAWQQFEQAANAAKVKGVS